MLPLESRFIIVKKPLSRLLFACFTGAKFEFLIFIFRQKLDESFLTLPQRRLAAPFKKD
jgi:hypothetical protein